MPEALAYFNGKFLPSSDLCIEVSDIGFVQGVAVSERMRTFAGKLFRVDEHFRRLRHSLEIVGLADGVPVDGLAEAALQLVASNYALLQAGDDLGLSLFVTPGMHPSLGPGGPRGPTIGMHTYPLPFHQWADYYEKGERLVVTPIRQVPPECWPPELKCRSRMHYYLADREAEKREPGARAILLDHEDRVIEASTANLIVHDQNDGLISPPREMILPGVSVAVAQELAVELGIPFSHRVLVVDDLLGADEVLLSGTSPCLSPVVSVNRHPVRTGRPGPILATLLEAWSQRVGLDIRAQAKRFANR